jgi:hypothetical protein
MVAYGYRIDSAVKLAIRSPGRHGPERVGKFNPIAFAVVRLRTISKNYSLLDGSRLGASDDFGSKAELIPHGNKVHARRRRVDRVGPKTGAPPRLS